VNQDFLSKKRDRICNSKFGAETSVFEINQPRFIQEKFDMAQLLRRSTGNFERCSAPVPTIAFSSGKRRQELGIES
jgi:hypothetical protein